MTIACGRRTRVRVVVAAIVASACGPSAVGAVELTYDPWELVCSGLNGALKSMGYAPSQSSTAAVSPTKGVLFAGGDDGGAWRSLDCGTTWEHVNGGPGVTEGTNGGYGSSSLGAHRILYYGPPGLDHTNMTVADFAAAPLPTGIGATGMQATFRTGRHLWWSNEDGKQWYPLSTFCLGVSDRLSSTTGVVAADAGAPAAQAHLVAASRYDIYDGFSSSGSQEASECGNLNDNQTCAMRAIAWTDNASEQMKVSLAKSNARANDAPFAMDWVSTWRYSSLAHLASGTVAQPGGCANLDLPKTTCASASTIETNKAMRCKGKDAMANPSPEDACLQMDSLAADSCSCKDVANCRYPTVHDLAIDPRNGWAYAATQVGLLVSPDGGRTWGRTGDATADRNGISYFPKKDVSQADKATLFAAAKTRLLTGIVSDATALIAPTSLAPVTATGAVYDLHKAPHRILDVGRISLVASPATCTNFLNGTATHYSNGRKRQALRVYVPVRWMARETFDADGQAIAHTDVSRSSVFVAAAGGCDAPETPLDFLDVATLKSGISGPIVTTEIDAGLPLPKLPRSQQYDKNHGYSASHAQGTCPLFVRQVAAAPSDPRIVYAAVDLMPSASTPCSGAYDCNWLRGIYRSIDGGMKWRLVAGPGDPSWPNFGMEPLQFTGLHVSAANPYVAWVTSYTDVFRLEPVAARTGLPLEPGCAVNPAGPPVGDSKATCTTCALPSEKCHYTYTQYSNLSAEPDANAHLGNVSGNSIALAACDKNVYISDICAQFSGAPGQSLQSVQESRLAKTGDNCSPPQIVEFTPVATATTYDYLGFKATKSASGLFTPPQCLHHFPSRPAIETTSLSGPASAACIDCTADTQVSSCGAVVAVVETPLDCCMHAVPTMAKNSDPICNTATHTVATPGGQVSSGASEEWVYDMAMAHVLTPWHTLLETFFTASDDSPTNLSGSPVPGGAATVKSMNGAILRAVGWNYSWGGPIPLLEGGAPSLGMAYLSQDYLDPVYSSLFPDYVGPQPTSLFDISNAQVWALFSGDHGDLGPSAFPLFGRIAVQLEQSAASGMVAEVSGTVLGRLWTPTIFSPYQGSGLTGWLATSRQFPSTAHKRIIAGPPGWLFVSLAGVGVFAVDKLEALQQPLNSYGQLKGVTYLGWGGNSVPEPGPAVQDIAYDGMGHLFAAVGDCNAAIGFAAPTCQPTAPNSACPCPSVVGPDEAHPCGTTCVDYDPSDTVKLCGKKFPTCDASIAPGVYMRDLSLATPTPLNALVFGPPVKVFPGSWQLVSPPVLRDPYVMTLVTAPGDTDGSTLRPSLLVGNWNVKKTVNDCAGGLYQLSLTTANLDVIGTSSIPAWRLIMWHDGISAIAPVAHPDPSGSSGILVGITGRQTYQRGEAAQVAGFAPVGGGTDVANVPIAPPHRPGVYAVELNSIVTSILGTHLAPAGIPWPTTGAPANCADIQQFSVAQTPIGEAGLVDCSDTQSTSCWPVEGSTAAPPRSGDDQAPASPGAAGLGHVLQAPTQIRTDPLHHGWVAVATAGNGAFVLPTKRDNGRTIWSDHGHFWAHGASPYSQLVLHTNLTATDWWRVQYAELSVTYAREGLDVGANAAILWQGQPLGCPVGSISSCLPGTGGGTARTMRFSVPAHLLATDPQIATSPAGVAELKSAHLGVSIQPVGPSIVTATPGVVLIPSEKPLGRVRIHAGATARQVSLDGNTLSMQNWTCTAGDCSAVLPGLGWTPGRHTVRVLDGAGALLDATSVTSIETTTIASYGELTVRQLDGRSMSVHALHAPPEHERRGSAWLRLKIQDPGRPLIFSLNGASFQLASAGPGAASNSLVDVAVDPKYLMDGPNELYATAFCASAVGCSSVDNLSGAAVVFDLDEELDHCMPAPEACNSRDDDCDGVTDESSGALCDGPDADGCSFGEATCQPGLACSETVSAGTLSPVPASFSLALSGIDAVFEDGVSAALPSFPPSIDLLAILSTELSLNLANVPVPTTGSKRIVGIRLKIAAPTSVSWNRSTVPVIIRSQPADDGTVLKLDFVQPLDLFSGTLFLHANLSPGSLPLASFFGCPGGEITYPSHVSVIARASKWTLCSGPFAHSGSGGGSGATCLHSYTFPTVQGYAYKISTCGSFAGDPYLKVTGSCTCSNDDNCDYGSECSCTATETGTATICASSYGSVSTSWNYEVTAEGPAIGPLTGSGANGASGATCLATYPFPAYAGYTYKVSTCGSHVGDTFLNVNGNCICSNDDRCDAGSECICSPVSSGTASICASSSGQASAAWNTT